MSIRPRTISFALVVLLISCSEPSSTIQTSETESIQEGPRERISINHDWWFTKGDPPGNTVNLLYDVRPEVTDAQDDRPADARPSEAVDVEATQQVLKPWILPTGNKFISDPASQRSIHDRKDIPVRRSSMYSVISMIVVGNGLICRTIGPSKDPGLRKAPTAAWGGSPTGA